MKINQNTKKFLYIAGLILPIIIVAILSKAITNNYQTKPSTTVPLINSIEKVKQTGLSTSNTKDIYKNLTPGQKITLNWNNVDNLPQEIETYSLKKTIINSLDINNLLSNLNFYEIDKQEVLLDQSLTWFNEKGSLFISPSLNHLSYYYRTPIPQVKVTTSKENLIKKSKEILSLLLDPNLVNTLDENPSVIFLDKNEKQDEGGPEIVSQNESNIASISYKQKLNSYPVITTSKDTDIITIAIDSKEKLYTLYINGGYSEVLEVEKITVPEIEKIKLTDTSKLFLVNNLDSLSMDKWYRDTKQLKVDVNTIKVGYYTGNEYTLIPVIIIEGNIKNPINTTQKVTYVLPIEEI